MTNDFNIRERIIKKLRFGVELELAFNESRVDELEILDYHESDDFDFHFWRLEKDGSLSTKKDNWSTCECVSRVLKYDDVINALTELYSIFNMRDGNNLANIEFNETTGAHIHLSFKKNGIDEYFNFTFCRQLYEKVCEMMKGVFNDEIIFKDWIKATVRSYALPKNDYSTDKYSQFYCSDRYNTLECRFFHLRGVKTKEQLEKALMGFMSCVVDTFEHCIKNDEGRTYERFYEVDSNANNYQNFYLRRSEVININNGRDNTFMLSAKVYKNKLSEISSILRCDDNQIKEHIKIDFGGFENVQY